jgi:archaetidylinositol phosphate synthase
MLGSLLRERMRGPSAAVGRAIGNTGISPNTFTVLAVVPAGAAAYALAKGELGWGLALVLVAFVWDAVDGAVARTHGKATKFGNYLDAMVDKYVEIIVYAGLALGGYAVESFFVMCGSLVLSYAKPRTALVVKIDNHDWPAFGERVERTLLLCVGLAVAMVWPTVAAGTWSVDTLSAALWVLAVIVTYGSVSRVFYARGLIEKGEPAY